MLEFPRWKVWLIGLVIAAGVPCSASGLTAFATAGGGAPPSRGDLPPSAEASKSVMRTPFFLATI